MARGVKRLLKILLVLILLGAIAYVSIVLMVCWKETHVAAPGKDYEAMLVLGAQVKPDGTPSLQLQWRLEKAAETYRQKKVPVVVCGGQGGNEPAPEAVVMRDVLIGLGVDEDMILMDTTSASTHSNIKNAMQLLGGRNVTKVMIITLVTLRPPSSCMAFLIFECVLADVVSIRIISSSTPSPISTSRMTTASGAGSLPPCPPQTTTGTFFWRYVSAAFSSRHCNCSDGVPSGLTCAPSTSMAS